MNPTRRQALLSGLFGAGYVGLRALATGLPAAVLLDPWKAQADTVCGLSADKAQYLILSTSDSGDPLNGNVPGTYDDPGIQHPMDPQMAPTQMTIGDQSYMAAKPWAMMPASVLARTAFFHHTTLTNNHANESKVMRLMGGTKRQEMYVSILAKQLAPCLGTIQAQPLTVGAFQPGEYLSYEGRVLPALSPVGLRDLLTSPATGISKLAQFRDNDLDKLLALYRKNGTPAQLAFLDRMASSRTQARSISQALIDSLSAINSNNADNQATAAAILIKMNVSPVVSMHIPFGGDNHTDANLAGETRDQVAGVGTIVKLQQKLADLGLQDKVTFVAMNVFGRTMSLARYNNTGRDHLANHHCTVMIGKGLRGSVIGGVEPKGNDYSAMAIDSKTGKGMKGGDIAFEDTLGTVGKTLAAAVGLAPDVINDQITAGKVLGVALAQ